MEQRVSLITLGVGDVARSRTFYEAMGWRGQQVDETVFFPAGGLAIVLRGRPSLAADAGVDDTASDGFGGCALAFEGRIVPNTDLGATCPGFRDDLGPEADLGRIAPRS